MKAIAVSQADAIEAAASRVVGLDRVAVESGSTLAAVRAWLAGELAIAEPTERLTRDDERALCARAQSGDVAARNELVDRLTPWLWKQARVAAERAPVPVDPGELIGAACEGLCDAIARFDVRLGFRLTSFAQARTRGAIADTLREQDTVARLPRRRLAELDRAGVRVAHELGRAPTEDEAASAAGMSPDELRRARASAALGSPLRPDAIAAESGEGHRTLTLAETAEASGGPSDRSDTDDFWREACRGMPARMRIALQRYYRDGVPMKAIGAELGVSETMISFTIRAAVDHVRRRVQMLGDAHPFAA
ncbi:MAG: sigma-70 family RNA polymerase sigma factor [Planctomycetota bacterium]